MIATQISSSEAVAIINRVAKTVIQYLGKAYEWLSINVPVVMNAAYELAQKTMIAARPHLELAGAWALEHQEILSASAIGAAAGFTLAYLIYARAKKSA
jgi:hypothetical protein